MCLSTQCQTVQATPDQKQIGTSYGERQKFSMRMHAPLHRLPNAFAKKVENDGAAVALCFIWYNLGRRI